MIIQHSFHSDSVELVELLIENGADISTVDFAGSAGETLIGLADEEEMVKLLISKGANLSVAESENRFTLLHLAAFRGRITSFNISRDQISGRA